MIWTKASPVIGSSPVNNNLILVNHASVFRVLQRHEAGETVRDEWRKAGRNKMMEDTEVQKIVDDPRIASYLRWPCYE